MPTAKLKENILDAEWRARLDLKFSKSNNKTILSHRKHYGPLQVQKPFYPELNGACHVYILHPPGGVVGGDRLNICVDVNSNAHALITTPAAGKFYRSAGPVARQEQIIKVASKGTLEWFPSENIIFSGARTQIQTKIELSHDSYFMGWEISCLGRPASDEYFSKGELDQRFEVWRDGRPLRVERLWLKGDDPVLNEKWGLHGFPVIGSMVCVTDKTGLVESLRKKTNSSNDQELFSATQTDGIIICSFLGNSVERARSYFIDVWKILRQQVIGREAVEPRIWKT
ncbi:MAG: urease accessory protein UreD [Nitrospinaceae bacterium]|jgi:urease accessory protein|nr:urease accessory protein [Nitrospinota bacterium]MBV52110.1 urease accessory protein [Nitrospinota bacterium]MDP6334700.1 urease accessory protein UreD [Nitrospinaceae bacterium]MDP7147420.1 urease accessory protein UreD [Nitrospinaceae bacterium]|tara:strand:+ start:560 stop:1414 length:855 start_codon:yes stop_codon:yes gene_type:complete